MNEEKIIFELVETNVFTRWPCSICGGCTEKVPILCEVKTGEYKKNDVCRCIARVYRWGALRPHRCSNPVWKDGYCKTHHFARRLPAD